MTIWRVILFNLDYLVEYKEYKQAEMEEDKPPQKES